MLCMFDNAAAFNQPIGEWTVDTGPFGAAGIMEIDEVIDPLIAHDLEEKLAAITS